MRKMRLTKPGSDGPGRKRARRSEPPRGGAKGAVAKNLTRMGSELVAVSLELIRLPIALYMRVAEIAGAVVLAGWLRVWPLLVASWRLARRVTAALERQVTPARATLVVALAIAVGLAASQFFDYRSVSVGVAAYADVQLVTSPPEVDTATSGSAHAWLGLPLAGAAILLIAGCALGRWRMARLLVPVGLAVVVISLAIDRPQGLDLGDAAIAYDGAEANLLSGFWAQLVCGVLLVIIAPLLTRALRAGATAGQKSPHDRRSSGPGILRRARGARRRLGRTAEAGS